jgi:hypothetical protein
VRCLASHTTRMYVIVFPGLDYDDVCTAHLSYMMASLRGGRGWVGFVHAESHAYPPSRRIGMLDSHVTRLRPGRRRWHGNGDQCVAMLCPSRRLGGGGGSGSACDCGLYHHGFAGCALRMGAILVATMSQGSASFASPFILRIADGMQLDTACGVAVRFGSWGTCNPFLRAVCGLGDRQTDPD